MAITDSWLRSISGKPQENMITIIKAESRIGRYRYRTG
ncbi:hypothetical protein Ppb6_02937 [Photorhabdus australis subsp. thailandensis]|uniref:Uncharacterized protein n=1 Tax=Photorhabdus australis subsp. thailandensis TaxID=2805096 RepID=A0A1C0U1M3_9GAMM|nr:hypothetical protein Ppb6_02937 [Photorhabdus australis subsp. thailandensis]